MSSRSGGEASIEARGTSVTTASQSQGQQSKSQEGQRGFEENRDAERRRKEEKSAMKKKDSFEAAEVIEEEEEEEQELSLDLEEDRTDEEEEEEEDVVEPNTYRLEPTKPFDQKAVSAHMQALLDQELDTYEYDGVSGPRVARALTLTIMQQVHSMGFHRHKLIVTVEVTEKMFQGAGGMVRFLWDSDRDNMALATIHRDTFYATAVLFALYYD